VNIIIVIIKLNCKWIFFLWQWYYSKTQHTKIHISHKITHRAETKHSTQTIKDTLHTMNKTKLNSVALVRERTMPTHKNVKPTLLQAVEAYRGCMILRIPYCLDTRFRLTLRPRFSPRKLPVLISATV
jgi:hypothetical protein